MRSIAGYVADKERKTERKELSKEAEAIFLEEKSNRFLVKCE